jgi:hypothetical protein
MPSGQRLADQTLRISITLPAEVAVQVRETARRRGTPVAGVVREFVVRGLARQAVVDRVADALYEPEQQAV